MLNNYLKLITEQLGKCGIEDAEKEARYLVCDALELTPGDLQIDPEREINPGQLKRLVFYLERRCKREPLQYIHGEVEFFGCRLKVNRHVLIPRPETEQLVELLAAQFKSGEVWDLCCGSGAIGIALKKANPELAMTLSDVSRFAVDIARENAAQNDVNCQFSEGDLFEPFTGRRADVIVSNPPYVTIKEFNTLQPEVRNFEPKEALVAGVDGLDFYRRFARHGKKYLNPGGRLILEIGFNQGQSIMALFEDEGWDVLELRKDWSGRDRFFFCRKAHFG